MKELGDMVRLAQGSMTGKRLSALSGVDASKISKLRNGTLKDTLPPEELRGLAEVLNLSQHGMLRAIGYDVGAPRDIDAEASPENDLKARIKIRIQGMDLNETRANQLRELIELFEEIAKSN